MKKLFSLGIMLLALVGVSFAVHSNSSSSWLPVENYNHNFHATLEDNGTVSMTWAAFVLPQGHSFKYWKVMRSQTNSNPVYKVDPYIKYNGNIGFTRYTDNSPKAGTNYYRVCAITSAYNGYHRYCSRNVDNIVVAGITNVVKPKPVPAKKPTVKPKPAGLSDSLKVAVDALIEKLMTKLDDKFNDDVDSKLAVLENLSTKLADIKVNYKVKPMITYLVNKIDDTVALLQIEALLNID